VKYAYIHQHRYCFPVAIVCRVLQVSRSGYYAWHHRPESVRAKANRLLLTHIQRIQLQSRRCYGAVKCWKQLLAEGIACGKHRVARLRRLHGIYAQRRKRFVVTARARYTHSISPNVLSRQFTVGERNRAWVGDTTFIATRAGWLFLAVMIDLFSRKVVGWSMANQNNGQLVLDSLTMAIAQRQPGAGLIHHTDQGATYAMQSYRDLLTSQGMITSMSRKRDCWDNAVAESFFSNLKNELIRDQHFNSREEARSAIFDYIEVFYNRQRLHQTLGYKSPEQFERMANVA